jgi:sarcosine oxidase delta subunit
MIEILLASVIANTPMDKTEQINRFCAYVVGIPYASDNFDDEEWQRFVYCRENLK